MPLCVVNTSAFVRTHGTAETNIHVPINGDICCYDQLSYRTKKVSQSVVFYICIHCVYIDVVRFLALFYNGTCSLRTLHSACANSKFALGSSNDFYEN